MKRLSSFSIVLTLIIGCAVLPRPALADSGHARIVRLSLVQGDVRFAREFHKDSLDDVKAIWEPAPLNLPIREGFALSTNSGARAEVEFENGAMAFLSGNTVIEFYDLSLDDGALITRLILRQGSAIFYVHPAKFDFFSVTGGDFSVEANSRARFRLDNYDDGSTVSVEQGHVDVLRKDETKPLEKGQSYSVNVNDGQSPVIGRVPEYDDFDKWVSGRIDSVVTASTYSEQYVNSPNYSSGFADLYSYGGWYNVPGYGFCWQPFGMGLGWSPFAFGSWYFDPFFGWNFIGSAPWGWLPYHYGGWIFNPGMGWVWVPTGFGFGGPVIYRPITGVYVHSGGTFGIVPLHPSDGHGKTPLNLNQGIFAVHGNIIAEATVPNAGEKWLVMSHLPHDVFTTPAVSPTPAPTKVSRTILSGNSGNRAVTLSRDSSIVYDPAQHRFVNNSEPGKAPAETAKTEVSPAERGTEVTPSASVGGSTGRGNEPSVPRATPPRASITPPAPPASSHNSSSSGGAIWSETGSASPAGSASSAHSTSSSTSSSGASHTSSHH